jgi:hypothetical protein
LIYIKGTVARRNNFLKAKVPGINDGIADAGVSALGQLYAQSWGFVFVNEQVMLGQGASHSSIPLYRPPLTTSGSRCTLF